MSPVYGDGAVAPHHPDLNDEVATLSTKLINAINHQTTLDDTLSATRLDLERAHAKVRQLESQIESQRELLAGDVWVRRRSVEADKNQLLKRVVDEKNARVEVEDQKKKIEQELENLTAALFEEANKMVITAKEEAKAEQDALQRKNDQLRGQLEDTEGLLRSQQDQLVELKHVMELMSEERDDQTNPTVPSSPGLSKFDARDDDGQSDAAPATLSSLEPLSPSYPTSFTHLLQPVLRTDLAAFGDFQELIRTSKRLSGTRLASTATFGLGGAVSNGSSHSLTMAVAHSATFPPSPNTPSSTGSAASGPPALPLPALKDTRFYKRALAEDIEPTMRLDTAPGLSWLARRTVLSAMTDGSLVVEPLPTSASWTKLAKPEFYPCSLCGESRRDEVHLRRHRFRTSESPTAQRYPLCKYCLTRVRVTCDFLGFLRMVKDGHWRAEDDDAEKGAWEESVRLREQMFWSRIGGGCVPTVHHHHHHHHSGSTAASLGGDKSPRPSHDESQKTQETADAEPSVAAPNGDGEQQDDAQVAPAPVDAKSDEPPALSSTEKKLPAAPPLPPRNLTRALTAPASSEQDAKPTHLSLAIPSSSSPPE